MEAELWKWPSTIDRMRETRLTYDWKKALTSSFLTGRLATLEAPFLRQLVNEKNMEIAIDAVDPKSRAIVLLMNR